MIVCGSNVDKISIKKEGFWEELSKLTETRNGRIIIFEELNGWMGWKANDSIDVIRTHGEENRNNNGNNW